MKKILMVLVALTMAVNTFALTASDSATKIKTDTIAAIKSGDMTEVIELLKETSALDAKKQAVVLSAVKAAFNSATVKKLTDNAVAQLMEKDNGLSLYVTKMAGGKWNFQFVTPSGNVKADIPRAAVEKPTLSTNPSANNR